MLQCFTEIKCASYYNKEQTLAGKLNLEMKQDTQQRGGGEGQHKLAAQQEPVIVTDAFNV